MRLFSSFAFVAASLAVTAAAHAGDKAAAQQHFREAGQLFDRGEIVQACATFARSYAEDAAPGTLYNLSICREREGRLDDAYRGFDELREMATEAGLKDRADSVGARANALVPKLARLDLRRAPDARSSVTGITIDDTVLLAKAYAKPVYVMPGTHRLVVRHSDGVVSTRSTTDLGPGDAQAFVIDEVDGAQGAEAAANVEVIRADGGTPPRRKASYIVGGVGLAFLAAGGALGIATLTTKSSAESACGAGSAKTCTSDPAASQANSDIHSAKTYSALSTVGFVAGGATLAAAVYLFATSGRKTEATTQAAAIVPSVDAHGGSLLLSGSF